MQRRSKIRNVDLLKCNIAVGQWTVDKIQLEIKEELPEDEDYIVNSKSSYSFFRLFHSYKEILSIHHLGSPSLIETSKVAANASMIIKEFYSTNWSKDDPDDAMAMRKEQSNKEFAWYNYYTNALWLTLLDGHSRNLPLLANWVESWFETNCVLIPLDPAWARIHVSVAASFRTEELEGQTEMEQKISKCRKKAPKLLFQAWNAARDGNQKEFENYLLQSVERFSGTVPAEINNYLEAIAYPQSIVLAAARRLGMKLPDFSPEIMAHLPTSESVGLEVPESV